ncbi:hypothetical protein [Lichenihabitans psoromatis]|uniref:hypothetical protein n=1 Tax=Lichenihabitans psoromatis TaxID=2528642 RepID=UPI001A93D02D|nr:hypothetical protein [Lichenihabitans psoromatis]
MIDRAAFFDTVRASLFGGWLSSFQVEGMTLILDEWERRKLTDTRHLAYALATTFHETGAKMQPVREGGGEAYLKAKPYYPWVGEGLVQVTWEVNARKFGATKPGDCMSWPVALRALFDGMGQGLFTGKKLSDYFNATVNDPVNARRIVNGIDKAEVIAGYHRLFLLAIGATAPAVTATPARSNAAVPVAPPQHIDKLAPTLATSTWGDWLKSTFFKRAAS